MKKIIKFLVLALVMFSLTMSTFAQASATASATATIVTPITLTKTFDMNFGNVAVSAITAGTVILAPAGTRTTGGAGGATLPAVTGTVTAATFSVTGQAGQTYAVTLPGAATTISNGVPTMTVDTWTSDITGALPETLHVGATLHVNAAQAAGLYTSAVSFTVTVNYN